MAARLRASDELLGWFAQSKISENFLYFILLFLFLNRMKSVANSSSKLFFFFKIFGNCKNKNKKKYNNKEMITPDLRWFVLLIQLKNLNKKIEFL